MVRKCCHARGLGAAVVPRVSCVWLGLHRVVLTLSLIAYSGLCSQIILIEPFNPFL